ncbi:Hypothetical protein A7982_06389 [Minicystis rosea]|nr:Hypothetical protein A7982_06389 [Minicystis rosea]
MAIDASAAPAPPSNGARSERRLLLAASLAIAVVALVAAQLSRAHIVDDAYIFFRYADNVLHGHGLTWNPGGERVEGYTSFLYLATLIPLRAASVDPVIAARVLNTLSFAGAAALSVPLARAALGERHRALSFAPLLIAGSMQLAQTAHTGMESALFLFLVVLALTLHLRGPSGPRALALSGLVFALAALTRPEGLLVAGACLIHAAVERRRASGSIEAGAEIPRLLVLLGVVAIHVAFRRAYYGEWLSNTYHAKVEPVSMESLRVALSGLRDLLASPAGLFVGASLSLWVVAPVGPRVHLIGALLLGWIAYLLRLGLDEWSYWYALPLHLFALLLAGLSLTAILSAPAPARYARGRAAVSSMLLVGLCFFDPARGRGGAFPLLTTIRIATGLLVAGLAVMPIVLRGAPAPKLARLLVVSLFTVLCTHHVVQAVEAPGAPFPFLPIAEKLREIAAPGETVAVGACGAIPYVSGLVTYDTLGLNDRHIAHHPSTDRRLPFGHKKGDGRYILSKHPTYLIPIPIPTARPATGAGFEKTFAEISTMRELRDDYEPVSLKLADGRYFNFHRRRAGH